jgi:hypothetical protein
MYVVKSSLESLSSPNARGYGLAVARGRGSATAACGSDVWRLATLGWATARCGESATACGWDCSKHSSISRVADADACVCCNDATFSNNGGGCAGLLLSAVGIDPTIPGAYSRVRFSEPLPPVAAATHANCAGIETECLLLQAIWLAGSALVER